MNRKYYFLQFEISSELRQDPSITSFSSLTFSVSYSPSSLLPSMYLVTQCCPSDCRSASLSLSQRVCCHNLWLTLPHLVGNCFLPLCACWLLSLLVRLISAAAHNGSPGQLGAYATSCFDNNCCPMTQRHAFTRTW